MINKYEKFLEEFEQSLSLIKKMQEKYVKCKKGCSLCCEQGQYPYSQIEFMYLTQGYVSLDEDKRIIVQNNINRILEDRKSNVSKDFEYKCPFLINNECSVYKYRGLVCRTFGLCYYDDKNASVKLPDCVHYGLNYSDFYFDKDKILTVNDVPKINLGVDAILETELFQKYELDHGEIRPMIEWLVQK